MKSLITKKALKELSYDAWLKYSNIVNLALDDAEKKLKEHAESIMIREGIDKRGDGLLPEVVRMDAGYVKLKSHFNDKFELLRTFNGNSPKKYKQRRSEEKRDAKLKA